MKLKTVSTLVALALTSNVWAEELTASSTPTLKGKISSFSQGSKTSSQLTSANKSESMQDNRKLAGKRVSQKVSRASSVTHVKQTLNHEALAEQKKQGAKQHQPQIRSHQFSKSNKHHDFNIFDARAYLLSDLDGDGYFSEFQVEFDADTLYNVADVYARLYISQNGGPWEHYYTTGVFEINGSQSSDDFRVTTSLNANYPTGSYDILVDLYEYGFAGVVATISSVEDADLFDLPLEDLTQEGVALSDYSIHRITTDLLTDSDNDGFYSEFAMALDIDTQYASAEVFVEIYFQNEEGDWELDFTSGAFTIEGDSTLDTQHFEFEWLAGYPTDYYNLKVVVVDAQSNQELFETMSEFSALNIVPLESADRDDGTINDNPPPPPAGPGDSSSRGNGGGSWGYGLLILMLPWLARKRNLNKKKALSE